ncbi:ankyrin [Chlorella virus XW01]|nr:ankyrin [Chlorella virus XW01]
MDDKQLIIKIFNMLNSINGSDPRKNTILHKLVESNNISYITEFLIIAKNKGELQNIINKKNCFGYTPLHLAVMNNQQIIAQLLIDYGADKNINTPDGYSIEHIDTPTK